MAFSCSDRATVAPVERRAGDAHHRRRRVDVRIRPGRDGGLDHGARGERSEIDVVLVWKFDRFARSSQQLITSLTEFRSLDVDFISYTEQIDTTAPWGKLVFTVFAGIAEWRHDVPSQRAM